MSHSKDSEHTRRLVLKGAAAMLTSACAPASLVSPIEGDWTDSGLTDEANSGTRSGAPPMTEWDDTGVTPPSYCETTAEAGEGPYFLSDAPSRTDLTDSGESGTIITLLLTFRNAACELLSGAVVDFWHAQQNEEYDMSGADGNYRCTLRTGFDGTLQIKTIRPIPYPLSETNWIPAHFHFKVRAQGHPELITQLRFVDDPFDDGGVPTEQLLNPTVAADGSETATYTFVLPT